MAVFFTKNDILIAYKKIKFEMFNDKNSLVTCKLYEFEDNLEENINSLYKNIKNGRINEKELICKEYFEIPKSIENIIEEQSEKKLEAHFFSSSLSHHSFDKSRIELKFRKVIDADIKFHILSALWISKVGQFIDEKFDDNIYGSRLTRIKPIDIDSCEYDLSNQKYNIESPKIFESYHHRYQSWRNNSFKAIRELHKTSSVIAVTMDITSFYHSIDLSEFTSNKFYKKFKLDLLFNKDRKLKGFHESFIRLLEMWNDSTTSESGLPIGLCSSPILANAVMKDFDDSISNLAPTYYGRYVDDILLVFPDNGLLNNSEEVINYLVSKKILSINEADELSYKNLLLKKSKQRIFYLDKDADLSIIDGIEAEINSISSEWRFLPDIADKNSNLLEKVIGFYADGKEFNDALRKIDATTIKRLGLSLLVSHSHSLNQFLGPKGWAEKRESIYNLIENNIFIPKNFFENFLFLPRIFRLMIHSNDGKRAYCFLLRINKLINELEMVEKKESSNKRNPNFKIFKDYSIKLFREVFYETFNINNSIQSNYLMKITKLLNIEFEKEALIDFNTKLFIKDLSFDSFSKQVTEYILTKDKKSLFKKQKKLIKLYNSESIFDLNTFEFYKNKSLKSLDSFVCNINKETEIETDLYYLPLFFPTRVFSPLNISIINPFLNEIEFSAIVNILRGTHSKVTSNKKDSNKLEIVNIANKSLINNNSIDIAITNFKVDMKYWEKSVVEKPVKDLNRFLTIQHMVNEAVKKKPKYLVLPELSIPQEWAWLISQKLVTNGISLITGVEYIHSIKNNNKIVHNSVMKFLVSDDLGFNYMKFFRQDKTIGAHAESIELYNIANITLEADEKFKDKKIYKHGNFYFSALICNELTNIENRFNLRGDIDCLFVVEWNQDIKSFNALVESASLDIHAYIIQVNNRSYGDSRIRAPYKNEFGRDVVQVKGGKHDYLIVGEVSPKKLREFQSHNISPDKPYKPVPTGFKMLEGRKIWDNIEEE